MAPLTEARHAGEFILSEGNRNFSRENIIVKSGAGKLQAGTVLGKTVTAGTASAAAKAGNTGGSGAITMDVTTPVLPNAKQGRYTIICIEPATNAGVFEVTDPSGTVIGTYNAAAAAFANQIKFTIADATDFVAGDGFYVDVTLTAVKYLSTDLTATDGSAKGCAILLDGVDATSADVAAVAIVRQAEVNGKCLAYHASVDQAGEIATKITELAEVGILVR